MRQTLKIYLPLLACQGGLLLGYDTGIIGSALLFIQPEFHLTYSLQGLTASTILLGIMLGLSSVSMLANRWEHRISITLATIIYILGYMTIAITTHVFLLILGRIIAGFAIGCLLIIIPLYLVEIAPIPLRGRFIAAFQLAITFGIFLGYLFSYWLAHYAAWRLMFSCGLLWALLLLISSFYLPTSSPVIDTTKQINTRSETIFQRKYYYHFVIGIGLAILAQLTGINAIMYFAPQVFQTLAGSNTSAVFSSLIIALGNFIFTIVTLFFLDSIGRRPILLFSLYLQCFSLAILGAISWWPVSSEMMVFMLCILAYIFGYAVGLGPISWIIISEIYPLAIRSKAMAMTIMINNAAAFLITTSFLTLLQWLNKPYTFWLFSLIAFIGFVFVFIVVPETKQKSLEEIQTELNQSKKPH